VSRWRRLFAHRLTRNTAALMFIQLVNYGVPLIVLVHLTRVLGLERYGVVVFAVGIVQFSAVLVDSGFTLAATARIAHHRDRPTVVNAIVSGIMGVKTAMYFLVATIVLAFALGTTRYSEHTTLLLLTLVPLFGLTFQPIWLFHGLERMEFMSVVMLITRVCYALGILLLVDAPADYLWVPTIDGLAQLLALTMYLVLMHRLGFRLQVPRARNIRYAVKLASGFFASRLAVTAYQSSAPLVLGALATPAATALYALAEQFYKAMQQLFVPLVQALYPYMARERDLRLLIKANMLSIIAVVLAAAAVYASAPWIIGRIFGSPWLDALPILHVFLVAIVVHVMAVMSGYPLSVALGRMDVANTSVIYGAIVFAIGLAGLVLMDRLGAVSLALLMIVAEAYVFVHRALALWPVAYLQLKQRPKELTV
jgi:PST family polysaccharide transporter